MPDASASSRCDHFKSARAARDCCELRFGEFALAARIFPTLLRFWVKTITGNEQLSCSELTGFRA
jgi:hypothetical protein